MWTLHTTVILMLRGLTFCLFIVYLPSIFQLTSAAFCSNFHCPIHLEDLSAFELFINFSHPKHLQLCDCSVIQQQLAALTNFSWNLHAKFTEHRRLPCINNGLTTNKWQTICYALKNLLELPGWVQFFGT